MLVCAKYVTEFTIQAGKIKSSRVIGEEYATKDQKAAILAARPLVRKFVLSRLQDEIQIQDCTVNVKVSYVERAKGLEISFKV